MKLVKEPGIFEKNMPDKFTTTWTEHNIKKVEDFR